MKDVQTVRFEGKNLFAKIFEDQAGYFRIQVFQRMYDAEEDVEYEIQVEPSPSSHFADKEAAIREAMHILKGSEEPDGQSQNI